MHGTEKSITVTDERLNGGRPTNIPLLVKGQKDPQGLEGGAKPTREQHEIAVLRALERAKASGAPLPSYDSIELAEKAAMARSRAGGSSKKFGLDYTPPPAGEPTGDERRYKEKQMNRLPDPKAPQAGYDPAATSTGVSNAQIKKMQELTADHAVAFEMTTLPPLEEKRFREAMRESGWYRTFRKDFGEPPNLNDPTYDYRGAWKQGLVPESGQPWPDRATDGKWFKAPHHPTSWMEYYQGATGRDPEKDGITEDQYRGMVGEPTRPRQENHYIPQPGEGQPGIIPLSKMLESMQRPVGVQPAAPATGAPPAPLPPAGPQIRPEPLSLANSMAPPQQSMETPFVHTDEQVPPGGEA